MRRKFETSLKAGLVVVLIYLLAAASAKKISEYAEISNEILNISFFIFLVFYIVKVITNILVNLKYRKIDMKMEKRRWVSVNRKYEENFEKALKALKIKVLLCDMFLGFMYLLCFCCVLSAFLYKSIGVWQVIITIAATLSLYSMICMSFSVENEDIPGKEVFQSEFPFIMSCIREITDKYGSKRRIRLFAADEGMMTTFIYRGDYCVVLGVEAAALMNKDEFRQIMIQGVAFWEERGAKTFIKLRGSIQKWGRRASGFQKAWNLCRNFVNIGAGHEFAAFFKNSGLAMEARADKATAEIGDRKAFASALVKTRMLALYKDEPDNGIRIFESELPENSFESKIIRGFKERFKEQKELWKDVVKREIPYPLDKTPTVYTRIKNIGIDDFDISFDGDEPEYSCEIKKLVKIEDDIVYDTLKDHYYDRRKAAYLNSFQIADEYLKRGYGKKLEIQDYIEIGNAFEDIGKISEAINVYDRGLSKYPDNANLLFFRGAIYLGQYDDRGLEMVFRALKSNENFIEQGFNLIERFCLKMGFNDRLEKYMEYSDGFYDHRYNDYSAVSYLTEKDRLSAHDIDSESYKEIMDYIFSVDNGRISKIYIVKKTVNKELYTNIFCIKPIDEVDEASWAELLHKIFLKLDVRPEQYTLFCLRELPEYENIVKKVEGSCVYSREKSERL